MSTPFPPADTSKPPATVTLENGRVVMAAVPWPGPPKTAADRVKELQAAFDPKSECYMPQQVQNVKLLIRLYESGQLKYGEEIVIMGGKVVTLEEARKGSEPYFHDHGREFHQRVAKASYGYVSQQHGQMLHARMRLLPTEGGDGTIIDIQMLNDTGSDIITIFHNDFQRLGDLSRFRGPMDIRTVGEAGGTSQQLPCYNVELHLVTLAGESWGPWFDEVAIRRPNIQNTTRLSGGGMRRRFYFGTGPNYDV